MWKVKRWLIQQAAQIRIFGYRLTVPNWIQMNCHSGFAPEVAHSPINSLNSTGMDLPSAITHTGKMSTEAWALKLFNVLSSTWGVLDSMLNFSQTTIVRSGW